MRSAFLICLVVILALSAYVFGPQMQSKPIPLRIAINPWPGYALLHIAKDQKYFENAGIDAELIEISDLYGVSRLFERGKVQAMTSTLVEVADIYRRSEKAAVPVLFTDYSNGADVILSVSPNVKNISDLKGKRVAVEPASLGYYLLRRSLERAGLDIKSVTTVIMPQKAMGEAVQNGTVDAIVSYPPTSTDIKSKFPNSTIIFDSSEIPNEILDIVSIDREYLNKHPDLVDRLEQVWAQAFAFYKNHPEKAVSIMAEKVRMDEEGLKSDLKLMKFISVEEGNKINDDKTQLIVLSKIISFLHGTQKFDADKFIFDQYKSQ